MTPENLIAWSAQVGVLTAVAAGAALALKTPRSRLFFWQAILAAALLLPLLQPRIEPRAGGDVSISTGPATSSNNAGHSRFVFPPEDLEMVIAAGIALRLLWIAVGFARLRRHRLAARAIAPPLEAPRVRWYLSETVSGPVTFGWLQSAILLPSSIERLDPEMREAIARHELIHVERGDWLFVVAEELIRAALWFHPAIWFVLSRIQLSREQTVDAEVVRRTRDRDSYLNALVAVAEQKFFPAPLFLKKRQLALRVAAVLKETNMPKSRVVARFAAVFSGAMLAARVAMWFFPMQAPAQTTVEAEDSSITVDAGAPLVRRTAIEREPTNEAGVVVVEALLNSKGEVSGAHVVSGPNELGKSVVESVQHWRYSVAPTPRSPVEVRVTFAPPFSPHGDPAVEWPPPEMETRAVLTSIRFVGVSARLQQRVRDRLPVREGDQISTKSRERILEAARQVDERFNARMNFGPNHDATLTFMLGPQGPPPLTAPAPGAPERIRVRGNVQAANLVQRVTPVYPPLAKASRVQGTVKLSATIDRSGKVVGLQLISGHPLLVSAAIQAVKQWEYRPTLLNGDPIEVVTEIDINFTLSH